MIRSRLVLCLIALTAGARAATFTVDTDHAEIGFTVRHLMLSDVKGNFDTFEGTIDYDPSTKELVSIKGSIDTASIDTNSEKRDGHLKSPDFFNVAEFPKMQFKSGSIEKTGDNTYSVSGKLSVLGVERKVVLPVTVNGPIEDPWGNKRIGLNCSTELNRRALGISNSPATVIGDEVQVEINAEAIMASTE